MDRILDVGCGSNKTCNAIGIDHKNVPGVDIVCDLNQPWPIGENSFDKTIFRHSINHLNNLEFALSEANRVTRPNGTIEIVAPHFSSDNIFTDPTVKFFLGYRSLNYYCENTTTIYNYYSDLKFYLEHRKIHLYKSNIKNKRDKIINQIIYPFELVINTFPRLYEKFFCFIFRANEIRFVLKVK